MKSLSTDTPEHDASNDDRLFELLNGPAKTAAPRVQMDKEGQDPGESPGDDDESTAGVNPYSITREERAKGSIDAPWGEQPKAVNNAVHFSDEVSRQFRQNREELLDRLFDGMASTQGAEQKLVGEHLSHGASGQFETSAPMLAPRSKIEKVAEQTLLERVRKIAGRH